MSDFAPPKVRVIVSNGSNQFHLAPLAAELDRMGVLVGFVTSGWPGPISGRVAQIFRNSKSVARFIARKESITPERIFATNLAEFLFQIGIRLRRISEHTEQRFDTLAFQVYTRYAAKRVAEIRPNIYHYRACYGGKSVRRAKQVGAVCLCDHSIAHPGVLQYMSENQGKWPLKPSSKLASPLQRSMAADISRADALLVNSQFVKETCVYAGVPSDRIHVVYLGVDDKFLAAIPAFDEGQVSGRRGAPLLFAGGFQQRKGAQTLAEAYLKIHDGGGIRLAAGIEAAVARDPAVKRFLVREDVETLGFLSRPELAREMIHAPVFVFPSNCEGSARVVFEAMAAGCFIITTPNAGTIVEDAIHGYVVPPGDVTALAAAIVKARNNPDFVSRVGFRNAQLVRREFLQSQYATRVLSVYSKLLPRVN